MLSFCLTNLLLQLIRLGVVRILGIKQLGIADTNSLQADARNFAAVILMRKSTH